jgi:hypothetical protein
MICPVGRTFDVEAKRALSHESGQLGIGRLRLAEEPGSLARRQFVDDLGLHPLLQPVPGVSAVADCRALLSLAAQDHGLVVPADPFGKRHGRNLAESLLEELGGGVAVGHVLRADQGQDAAIDQQVGGPRDELAFHAAFFAGGVIVGRIAPNH